MSQEERYYRDKLRAVWQRHAKRKRDCNYATLNTIHAQAVEALGLRRALAIWDAEAQPID